MACSICGQEAVDRCFGCGQLFCAMHGNVYCVRCKNAVVAGDPRQDRITADPARTGAGKPWWHAKQAEEYRPPECYVCKGLTRQRCYNCGSMFCPEHGSRGGLCRDCNSSSLTGLVIGGLLIALLAIIGVMYAL